jgi:hypothetical protein
MHGRLTVALHQETLVMIDSPVDDLSKLGSGSDSGDLPGHNYFSL